jgi:hypothetical protein
MIKSRDFYHDFVFPNFAVLKAMDEKGGCLNYTAIDIIRDLECQYWIRAGLFEKKLFKSVLSSKLEYVISYPCPFISVGVRLCVRSWVNA